jgi:hypothetical protein
VSLSSEDNQDLNMEDIIESNEFEQDFQDDVEELL